MTNNKASVALSLMRSSVGRKLLLSYSVARIFKRPINLRLADSTLSADREDIGWLIALLNDYIRLYGLERGQNIFVKLVGGLYGYLRAVMPIGQAIDGLKKLASYLVGGNVDKVLVEGPKISDDGYIDFKLNYFGKKIYTIGYPVRMLVFGFYLGDENAIPRPSFAECKPMTSGGIFVNLTLTVLRS